MRSGPAPWLAALRRRQRTVIYALLPAFTLAAASGPACAAMLPAPAPATTQSHSSSDAHAVHRHAAAATEELAKPTPTPCPHCPFDSGAANAGHAGCVAVDAQKDAGAAPPIGSGERIPPALLLPNWLLPAARAAPPLISSVDRSFAQHLTAVPRNLRHCVLLI